MKANLTLLTIFLLVMSLNSTIAHSANNSAALTQEEEALWQEVFADDQSQTQPKKQTINEGSINLTGQWVGYFEYDMPKGQPEGMFTAVVKEQGNEFSMSFLEPRNHATKYVQAALTIDAKRQGKYLSFTKSYGNYDTVVQYNLIIRHNGLVMDGTWRINDNVYGRAFFYRLKLDELKELKQQSEI
ncbi:hypothetical protein GCM10009123_03110 [Kangiella japonica]|uniref:DUF4488 domain-containing protein n=1 Tax=Kangiella japonica TaxID=647384 RepID=A0ABN0STV8_9GAMM